MNAQMTPEFFLMLAIGLGLLAFGWVLVRFGIHGAVFGLGFLFGFNLYTALLDIVPRVDPKFASLFPDNPYTALFVGAVMGICALLLSKKLFQVLIFVGSLSGILYLLYFDEQQRALLDRFLTWAGVLEPLNRTVGNLWPAAAAILLALLVLYLQKRILMIITACVGSYIISDTLRIPILFLPLCFVGILLQQAKRRPKRKETAEE